MEAVVMFGSAYSGRRVFITGHTGFKGSWLTAWLLALGADVTGYALEPPTEPSLFDALGLDDAVCHVVADVRDHEVLERELSAARPEAVFHLAAQPIVRESYARPRETFETNIMGTVNLLEAVRSCSSVGAVVVVTSDKCYRNRDDGRRFREDDALGGHDPYSASKACEDLVGTAYGATFLREQGVAVATARAGNVIGGGDWAPDRLVPDCVRALAAGVPVEVRSPDAVRPWQHVLEPLSGYLLLGAGTQQGGVSAEGAWNFGPSRDDSGLAVRWVVERFVEEWGSGSWAPAPGEANAPHEALHLDVDSDKATRELCWTPAWSSREAVRRTAAWYRRFSVEPQAAAALVQDDLAAYSAASPSAGGERTRSAAP